MKNYYKESYNKSCDFAITVTETLKKIYQEIENCVFHLQN